MKSEHCSIAVVHGDPRRVLFRSKLVEIGLFECPRNHPQFHDSGPIRDYVVVFPRQPVRIVHQNHADVVASRQVITLYNDQQEYRRQGISDRGDRSLWLRFRKAEVVEALHASGRCHAALERMPFAWTHARCDAQTFLLQSGLYQDLVSSEGDAWLHIAETAMHLLHRAVQGTDPGLINGQKALVHATARRHQQLTRRCESLLASGYPEPWTLESIAAELATTPFHLSRVFARMTGQSIHQYLIQQRLRAAMDQMTLQPGRSITDIGLAAGFSTPSHFTQTFRRHFGLTPRQFRAT